MLIVRDIDGVYLSYAEPLEKRFGIAVALSSQGIKIASQRRECWQGKQFRRANGEMLTPEHCEPGHGDTGLAEQGDKFATESIQSHEGARLSGFGPGSSVAKMRLRSAPRRGSFQFHSCSGSITA